MARFKLVLGKSLKEVSVPNKAARKIERVSPVKKTLDPRPLVKALKATYGAKKIIEEIPTLATWQAWLPTATFSVCQKTGTATYLDIWDADHFDGFTDMHRNLQECRVWFSADGFTHWGSANTKTGRINCYFRAPASGTYVCNVELQSHGGSAKVECLIDSFSFGPLDFNGSIDQPHGSDLGAGYHHFRIRQMSGSFFFVRLTVWRV